MPIAYPEHARAGAPRHRRRAAGAGDHFQPHRPHRAAGLVHAGQRQHGLPRTRHRPVPGLRWHQSGRKVLRHGLYRLRVCTGCWAGFAITVIPILIIGLVARLVFKINFTVISGLLAGSMTDPPALAFANAISAFRCAFRLVRHRLPPNHASPHPHRADPGASFLPLAGPAVVGALARPHILR